MKQTIVTLTIPEFTWRAIDGLMEQNGLAPLYQNGN